MDSALHAFIKDDMPPLNKKLADGLATTEIPKAPAWVKKLFKSIEETFPPGLEWDMHRCSSREEYREATHRSHKTARNRQRSSFDIAESQVYMMRLSFKYKGKQLKNRYLYLPYVSDGGFITISDSRYTISPVAADRVISIMKKAIFARLIKSRFNVNRISQNYNLDDEEVHAHVVWSKIHQKKVNRDRHDPDTIIAESTLAHYLFCKYGIIDAFRRFAGCDVVVGSEESITTEKYPKSNWIIARTSRIRSVPKPTSKRRDVTKSSHVRIAIPREQMTPMAHNLLGAFFYIADRFQHRVDELPIHTTNQNDMKLDDEKRMWLIVLGHLISPTAGHGKVLKEMEGHIRSLDEYIDPIVREQLSNVGFDVSNVYQLFAALIERFDTMLLDGRKHLSSMYGKELNVLYFVLFEISRSIVELGFRMLKLTEEPNLTPEKIDSILGQQIRTNAIFRMYKSTGAVAANSYPGDNKIMKITLMLMPQQQANKSKNKKRSGLQLDDPMNQMHMSVVEHGGAFNLLKGHPSGWFRLNIFTPLSPDNVMQRHEKYRDMMDKAQHNLEK